MTDHLITTLRSVFRRWERYSALQFTAPIQLFHDGR